MNELRQILCDTVERLFTDTVTKNLKEEAEQGDFPRELWDAIEENGLLHVLVPEELGGAGAQFGDAEVIARAAGRHAVPLPIVETILANWLLSQAGLEIPGGITSLAPVRRGERIDITDGKVSGSASRVPWGRNADQVVVVSPDGALAVVNSSDYQVKENQNVASEPRDTLTFKSSRAVAEGIFPNGDAESVFALGAMMRSSQMAGALEWILETSVQYANDRTQFGRLIGKFQAVQQNLAVLAGHTAASSAAAIGAFQAADQAADCGLDGTFEIAAAKTRTSEAAGIGTSFSHQVHGAIGFTYEHDLHFRTRRLWSWRDEFGTDSYWADWIGEQILQNDGNDLWPWLTTRPT